MTDDIYTPDDQPDDTVIIPEEPVTPPERSLIVQMQFETEGEEPTIYVSRLEHPYGTEPVQYAKGVAETVERTALLHLGALPVLAKVEA